MCFLARVDGTRNNLVNPCKFCCTHALDRIVVQRERPLKRLGIDGRLLGNRAIHSMKKAVVVLRIGGDKRNNGHAQARFEFLRIDALALLLGDVHKVEHQHAGRLRGAGRKIGQNEQAAFELRGIDHHQGGVNFARNQKIVRHFLFGRVHGKAVCARKVDDPAFLSGKTEFSHLLFDCFTRPVAYMLMRASKPVEKC